MVTHARTAAAIHRRTPSRSDREIDPVWCELVELRERFAEGSALRRKWFDRWRDHVYWEIPVPQIAVAADKGERWVRRKIDDVAASLRALHGPPFGHPVEELLGY